MIAECERLKTAVRDCQEEYVALLTDLVRCPSTLGNEKGAQELLLQHVRSMGLDGELWDLDPETLQSDPDYVASGRQYAGRHNLTATLPPKGHGGQSLVLNGHIDVVSAEPTDWWQHDPWGAQIENGRLYGRGALDMKGGLVQALLAIRAVQSAEVFLRGAVIFESVIEEECTGNGTLACRGRSGPIDAAVLTEPVGLTATTANTGTLWARVVVKGRPAYVGQSGLYVNAVEKASYLISQLDSIAEEINTTYQHPAFAAHDRPFTLSVGTIESGDWPSNVPLVCRFTCRLSYPPGVDVQAIQRLVERHIRDAAANDSWLSKHIPHVDYPGFRAHGWVIDADAPLVTALGNCHQLVTGKELQTGVLLGTADARYFDRDRGEQAVYYGPCGANMHAPDEYVDLASIVTGAETLACLIADWCG